jgi:hypothetical protein
METVEKKSERLLRAIDWGDEAAVREILETGGVDLNGPREVRLTQGDSVARMLTLQSYQDGWTLLNKASARGYLSIVELLLAAGADPNAANEVRSHVELLSVDGWGVALTNIFCGNAYTSKKWHRFIGRHSTAMCRFWSFL